MSEANFDIKALREAARRYFEQGIPVIPAYIYFDEKKQRYEKIFLVDEWKKWQTEPQTVEEFENLNWEKANGFAIINGVKTKDGLYVGVVDFDVKGLEPKNIEVGKRIVGELPITQLETTVNGGEHRIYLSRKPVQTVKSYRVLAGVELLGRGTIAVMAPSFGYKRLNDNTPTIIEDLTDKFMKAVGKYLDLIPAKKSFLFEREADRKYSGAHPVCIEELLKGVPEGMRNETAIRLACYFINFRGWKEERALEKLIKWNAKNKPPLDEAEIRAVVKSAVKGGYNYGCNDRIFSQFCCDECVFWHVKLGKKYRKEALELLTRPDSILKIIEALKEQGVKTDFFTSLDIFFSELSRKLANKDRRLKFEPLNIRLSSLTSTGKSWVVIAATNLQPPEEVICRSGLSKKAVWHMKESVPISENKKLLDLRDKVLVILEESESKDFLNEIKPILSHDMWETAYEYTDRRRKGEQLTSCVQVVKGWPAYVGLTTVPEKNPEQQSRAVLVTPSLGNKKYRKVIMEDNSLDIPWECEEEIKYTYMIQEAIRRLEKPKFWAPWFFIVKENFPTESGGVSMRKWVFFKNFILSIAFWYQKVLPKVKVRDEEYVLIPIWVYELALLIKDTNLIEFVRDLEPDVIQFYQHLLRSQKEYWRGYRELQQEAQQCFGQWIARTTLTRRYIEPLEQLGLIEATQDEIDKRLKKFTVYTEKMTNLTKLKIILSELKKPETKEKIKRKIMSIGTGIYTTEGRRLSPDEVVELVYTRDSVDIIFEELNRIKMEEIQEETSKKDLVGLVIFSDENKPKSGEFKCPYCPCVFGSERDLKAHLKTHNLGGESRDVEMGEMSDKGESNVG